MLVHLNADAIRALRECQRIRDAIGTASKKEQATLIEESRSYAVELVTEITRCNPMQIEPVTREDLLEFVEAACFWVSDKEFPSDPTSDYNDPFFRRAIRWLVAQGLLIETGNVAKDGSILYRQTTCLERIGPPWPARAAPVRAAPLRGPRAWFELGEPSWGEWWRFRTMIEPGWSILEGGVMRTRLAEAMRPYDNASY